MSDLTDYEVGMKVRTTQPLNAGEDVIPVGTEGVVQSIWGDENWPHYAFFSGWPIIAQLDGVGPDPMEPKSGLSGSLLGLNEIEPIKEGN